MCKTCNTAKSVTFFCLYQYINKHDMNIMQVLKKLEYKLRVLALTSVPPEINQRLCRQKSSVPDAFTSVPVTALNLIYL